MRDVLVAQFLRSIVWTEVIIAIGHPQSALPGIADRLRAVLEIRYGTETEHRVHADALQSRRFGLLLRRTCDLGDALKFRLKRRGPGGFDARFVHTTSVKIADFLVDRTGCGVPVLRRGLQNLAQNLLVLVAQYVEMPPG